MRRALLGLYSYVEFFLLAIVFTPLLVAVAVVHRRDPTRRIRGRWMRRFGRTTSRLSPIWRFSVEGMPPADVHRRGYVVVSNHESTADPFLLSFLPWDMRWVAKEELFRLPLIGWMLRAGGDVPLRRGDRASAEAMLRACRETLELGLPVMIFPEGTRSATGDLLPFRDGAFRLAIEAGVPVLPLALSGTRACRPKGSLWFGEARAVVRILEPIETRGLSMTDLADLRERTRDRISGELGRLREHEPVAGPVRADDRPGAGPVAAEGRTGP